LDDLHLVVFLVQILEDVDRLYNLQPILLSNLLEKLESNERNELLIDQPVNDQKTVVDKSMEDNLKM